MIFRSAYTHQCVLVRKKIDRAFYKFRLRSNFAYSENHTRLRSGNSATPTGNSLAWLTPGHFRPDSHLQDIMIMRTHKNRSKLLCSEDIIFQVNPIRLSIMFRLPDKVDGVSIRLSPPSSGVAIWNEGLRGTQRVETCCVIHTCVGGRAVPFSVLQLTLATPSMSLLHLVTPLKYIRSKNVKCR